MTYDIQKALVKTGAFILTKNIIRKELTTMNRIFITGDTHGEIDLGKLKSNRFPVKDDLTKDDYLIIVGDVAIIWYGWLTPGKLKHQDQTLLDWFENQPFTTLFIDGNHENHKALNEFPVEEWHGGKIHKLSDSVYHLMRGQVFDIAGHTFFTMGGANSVDKAYRTEDVSWWKEELPSPEDYAEAMKNLQAHNMKVDYVLTHDCATTYVNQLVCIMEPANELQEFFRRLEFDEKLDFKMWYFGHHHVDRRLDDKHVCLYNDIVEIE